ncbi:MAG: hypothetical protein LBE74_07695 [Treponema sp.]|jgi:hypothetical protein|nr:hypothetical protein [Treponema sp.]
MADNPEKLSTVRGISPSRALRISVGYRKISAMQKSALSDSRPWRTFDMAFFYINYGFIVKRLQIY